MRFAFFVSFFCGSFIFLNGQSNQISFGVFTGITSPYTFDSGINRDSRYEQRHQVKLAPIGISYGVDYQGYGFVITPSLMNIGQNMNIVNSLGGNEGTRHINMQYVQLPIGFKLHMIQRPTFKLGLVAGVGAGYLLKANETIDHNNAKYRFPAEVFPILPPDYIVEFDGVVAPEKREVEIVSNEDFEKFQVFTSLGFRSDIDLKNSWRLTFDLRANYGLTETRTEAYMAKAREGKTLYDLSGDRRELFASLNIGIARSFEGKNPKAKKSFGKRKSKKSGGSRKRKPRH